MSKQANPRIVGAFVVGAAVLATVAVVTFGSFEFESDKFTCVIYFDGSVAGLSAGSPVLFRGASIGEVTEVVVRFVPESTEPEIPVYIEIDRGNIEFDRRQKRDPGEGMPSLIEKGLRAKLVTLSMITGQLAVMLDFLPDVPAKYKHDNPGIIEIPSAPSLQEQITNLFEEIKKLPVKDLLDDMRHTVQGVDELVRSDKVTGAIDAFHETLDSFKKLADDIDGEIDPLANNLNGTMDEARAALKKAREAIASVEGNLNTALEDADHLIKNIDGKIDPLNDTLQGALKQADNTLASAEKLISQDSPTMYRLNVALEELSSALRSIRALADYLQQHPESVLKGKSQSGGSR